MDDQQQERWYESLTISAGLPLVRVVMPFKLLWEKLKCLIGLKRNS